MVNNCKPTSGLMLDTAGKKSQKATKIIGTGRRRTHTTRCTLKSLLNCVFLTMRGGRVPKDFLGCVFGSMIDLHKNERSSFLPCACTAGSEEGKFKSC
jgi:hypothetical protein